MQTSKPSVLDVT
jgi:hypothetical protein